MGLSKLAMSRVIIRVAPFRALRSLLITYLLSPLPLQVIIRPLHWVRFPRNDAMTRTNKQKTEESTKRLTVKEPLWPYESLRSRSGIHFSVVAPDGNPYKSPSYSTLKGPNVAMLLDADQSPVSTLSASLCPQ